VRLFALLVFASVVSCGGGLPKVKGSDAGADAAAAPPADGPTPSPDAPAVDTTAPAPDVPAASDARDAAGAGTDAAEAGPQDGAGDSAGDGAEAGLVDAADGPTAAVLTAGTTSIDFGCVPQGSIRQEMVRLQNRGSAPVGPILLSMQSDQAPQLHIESGLCTGKTLAPGEDCALAVYFSPATVLTLTGTLQATAPSGEVLRLPLSGSSRIVEAGQTIPSQGNFGSIKVGESSTPVTLRVFNWGGVPYTAGFTVTINGPSAAMFALETDTCSNGAIAPGESCSVTVRFQPTAVGDRIAWLHLAPPPRNCDATIAAPLVGSAYP
jgi:hypothetical protein